MIGLPHVAQRVFDTPLLIDAGKAEAFALGLGARICGETIELSGGLGALDHVAGEQPLMGRVGDRLGRAYEAARVAPYDRLDGVAIIPIEGTLVQKGAYVGAMSGRTSYQGIQTQVRMAARDPEVKGVVLEVDSMGGEAAGAFDTADMIAELSAQKPTLAILTSIAASAGYLLASAARQIVMPAEGLAG
jgi:ClpP class serine protease